MRPALEGGLEVDVAGLFDEVEVEEAVADILLEISFLMDVVAVGGGDGAGDVGEIEEEPHKPEDA